MRTTACRALLILLFVVLAGCNSSKGRQTSRTQAFNLVVTNLDREFEVDVYLDGAHFGSVPASGRSFFWVAPGTRFLRLVSDERLPDDSHRTVTVGNLEFRAETVQQATYYPGY